MLGYPPEPPEECARFAHQRWTNDHVALFFLDTPTRRAAKRGQKGTRWHQYNQESARIPLLHLLTVLTEGVTKAQDKLRQHLPRRGEKPDCPPAWCWPRFPDAFNARTSVEPEDSPTDSGGPDERARYEAAQQYGEDSALKAVAMLEPAPPLRLDIPPEHLTTGAFEIMHNAVRIFQKRYGDNASHLHPYAVKCVSFLGLRQHFTGLALMPKTARQFDGAPSSHLSDEDDPQPLAVIAVHAHQSGNDAGSGMLFDLDYTIGAAARAALIEGTPFTEPPALQHVLLALAFERFQAADLHLGQDKVPLALEALHEAYAAHRNAMTVYVVDERAREIVNDDPIAAETVQALRTRQASQGGRARAQRDPRAQEKRWVRECWEEWQRTPTRYASKAAFARDMVDSVEALTSVRVIEAWCRDWERQEPASS